MNQPRKTYRLATNSLGANDEVVSSSTPTDKAHAWALDATAAGVTKILKPPPDVDFSDWKSAGWGLILPYRNNLSNKELASASDAPKPIQLLCEMRNNAPIFRYRADTKEAVTHIRNYATRKSVPIENMNFGVKRDAIPFYLLIYGTPDEIPWRFQYQLNATHAVGRLDLTGRALQNYVRALINDWQSESADASKAIIWAAETDAITKLMGSAIARKVYRKLQHDRDYRVQFISRDKATQDNLISALKGWKPGLVITTSHGSTSPWSNPRQMSRNLGLMIDQNKQTLDLKKLSKWEPNGAIWYAHACCSAGSDQTSVYDGLFDGQTPNGQLLNAVTKLGAKVAPLPRALLGAPKPLRCFIGHVEPTFDWTIRPPEAGDDLTKPLVTALYNNLYSSKPVGLAFRDFYRRLLALSALYDEMRARYNQHQDTGAQMVYSRLAAWDIKSTVILGDPALSLSLPSK